MASADRREALAALYALNLELAKVAIVAKSPIAGEIRLAWWREEVDAIGSGARPADHPALRGLSRQGRQLQGHMQAMIEGRHAELERRPFPDEDALAAYLDGVDGGMVLAACAILDPDLNPTVVETGRCLGYARLIRERAGWLARGADWTPQTWGDPTEAELTAHLGHMMRDKLVAAKGEIRALSVAAFPAVASAALIGPYLRGARPSQLERRLRFLLASLTGRI